MTVSLPADVIRQRWLWRSAWAIIVVVGIVLKAIQTTVYIFASPDDDALMVQMAHGFLNGRWSSSWSTSGAATFSKPVGYPLFLAGAHFLPWSPVLSVYLLCLLGAGLIAWGWLRMSGSRPQTTLVLAILVFNPIAFTASNQRIYRDFYVDGLSTVAIGLAFVLAIMVRTRTPSIDADPSPGRRHIRRGRVAGAARIAAPYLVALLVGLLVGMSAITRPTWMWLVPAVGAPLLYPVVVHLRRSTHRLRSVLLGVLAGVLFAVAAGGVVEATKYMDKRTYGVALTDDFSAGSLAQAWKAWASVQAGPPEKDVVITKPMRQAVYRVSPAAAALEPYLESPKDPWKAIDCNYPSTHVCNDAGAWFIWDLLTTAASIHKINSVEQTQTYFGTIAQQITAACKKGELTCTSSPVLAAGLPPLNRMPLQSIATDTLRGLWHMTASKLPTSTAATTPPTSADYALWSSVVSGMPSATAIGTQSAPSPGSTLLNFIDLIYRALNVALLAVLLLGGLLWLLRGLLRSRWLVGRADIRAAVPAALFLVAAAIGMATLAVFDIGQGSGFLVATYWTDFTVPFELFLTLGAFAVWPVPIGVRPAGSRPGPSGTTAPTSTATVGGAPSDSAPGPRTADTVPEGVTAAHTPE